MATVTSQFDPDPRVFPFSGISDPQRFVSGVPRSEVSFSVRDGAVAAPGVGNNQYARTLCTLPANFAYVLVDLFVSLECQAANVNYFDDQISALLTDDNSGVARCYEIVMPLETQGPTPINTAGTAGANAMNYVCKVLPKNVVFTKSGSGSPKLDIQAYNAQANDAAYYMNVYARFLQFDIDQINQWPVNSPLPVR